METLDNGKIFPDALGDIHGVMKCLRYYAGWADKITGQTISAGQYKRDKMGTAAGGGGGPDNLRASEPCEACKPCEACEPSENINF